MIRRYFIYLSVLITALAFFQSIATAQSMGSAGTISGTVTDSNKAVIPGAVVSIENAVTGFSRSFTTGTDGVFRFNDVPPNTYTLTVQAEGFAGYRQPLNVRTSVPVTLTVELTVGEAAASVTISSGEALDNVPTAHTDVDKTLIDRLPVRSPGSGLSDIVTLSSPGVVADSNGFMHPLGDHAQTSFVIDNQQISDQQSKAFSTQLPPEAIQSMQVTTGATPAWYGDKDSLVVDVITRSGMGQNKPTGSFNTTYGTFGTVAQNATFAYGGKHAGNFVTIDFDRSGRFLDAPEFVVIHDRGTAANIFDRFDYSPNAKDTFHLNLSLARNNFQIPNTFDQQSLGQDQHQLVRSLNIAPGLVHIFSPTTVLTISPYFRMDQVRYFPSANPFSDETTTINQNGG